MRKNEKINVSTDKTSLDNFKNKEVKKDYNRMLDFILLLNDMKK
jgi:hypothetical protein